MLNLQRQPYVKPSIVTTMAIIENMWLRKAKKRLGGVVLYQAMEQTRARELASSITNPRTQSQMTQRVKWAQLVNFYRANGSWMKYAYETKTPQQSEYNKFMSLNVADSQVYLSKQLAAAGSCLVYPYIMTQGSLPSIEFTEESGSWPSNIYYPTGSFLLSTTTVAEFSQKILQMNPAVRQGDQLSFVRFTQMYNSDTGYPYVVVRRYEILIDQNSTSLVGDYLPLDYISVVSIGTPNQLAVVDSGLAGGFLLCLSRTTGGKTYVSSQRIIVTGMSEQLQRYGSAAALALAIQSYGEQDDAFLSTTTANTNNQAQPGLSLIGLSNGNVSIIPGRLIKMTDYFAAGDSVHFIFNTNVNTQTVTSVALYTNKKAIQLSSTSVTGNYAQGTIPSNTTLDDDEYLITASVRFENGLYVAQFQQPQDDEN